jgi:hypothetical protein
MNADWNRVTLDETDVAKKGGLAGRFAIESIESNPRIVLAYPVLRRSRTVQYVLYHYSSAGLSPKGVRIPPSPVFTVSSQTVQYIVRSSK